MRSLSHFLILCRRFRRLWSRRSLKCLNSTVRHRRPESHCLSIGTKCRARTLPCRSHSWHLSLHRQDRSLSPNPASTSHRSPPRSMKSFAFSASPWYLTLALWCCRGGLRSPSPAAWSTTSQSLSFGSWFADRFLLLLAAYQRLGDYFPWECHFRLSRPNSVDWLAGSLLTLRPSQLLMPMLPTSNCFALIL